MGIIMRGKNNSVLNGALALTLSVFIVKAIGLIYKLPLSYILDDEGMGYFNSAYTVFTFFYMLCTGGIPRAISIVIAESEAKQEYGIQSRVLSVSFKFFVTVGIIFTVLLFAFAPQISVVIWNKLSVFSLLCIAPSLTFVSASGVLRGYLNGRSRLSSIAIAEVLEGVIKFIIGLSFAIIAYRTGFEAPIISAFAVCGITLGSFVGSLYLYICSKIEKREYITEQNSKLSSFSTLKRIVYISVPITFSSAVMGFSNMVDLGMITSSLISLGMAEAEAVALYGNYTTLVVPMINLVSALIAPIGTASLPELTSSYARNDIIRFKDFSVGIIKICSFITVPVCFYYIFFSGQILGLVFRDSSAAIAAPLLSVMAPCAFFIPLLTMVNTLLEASGNQKYPMISMSVGMGIKTLLLLILIQKEGIGIISAPISTCLAYGVALILSLAFVNKKLGFSLPVMKHTVLAFFASVISFCPAFYFYDRLYSDTETYFSFILAAIACGVVYVLLLVVFMPSEIVKLLTYVKSNKKNIELL